MKNGVPQFTRDQMDERLGNQLRVACFTTKPLNGPMWTHYGNFCDEDKAITPHGGLCIEYAVNEDWRQAGLKPVEYAERRPVINMLERDSLEKQFADATRVKSPDWIYEDEWRIVGYLVADPAWPGKLADFARLKLEGSVRSVILGLNAKDAAVDQIVEAVRTKLPKIAIQRVVRDATTAALTLKTVL